MYALKTHPLVEEDLKAFDNSVVILILKKLAGLQHSPFRGQPLGNKNNLDLTGYYKTYVSKKQIRIVYKIIDNELVVYVVTIGKREEIEVYKEALKRLN
ncbi:type II toxin-antitoxin system RelE family toxin [Sulfurospirillum deleyianum]|uniref:Plasmid stabilization system n=1 Tax=Sulfurospirillum deleyianum (strain ATCC 51133 / DSM 6946 / 5175) TaxID=525898 RepID=D1B144_SULD5|nr:type II toxin-antitoxin system RelE/ParE family toxin [Sulfurospirillum deleyianum]ACZ11814.1 plasmid stabilization system [Sulfurospirillum deleyianum DSM 6946]